jgi:hypothetical protein
MNILQKIQNSKSSIKCHLWTSNISKEDLYESLQSLEILDDDNHLMRSIETCKSCGQLYFREFYEWIDYENGNDPQYWTFVPIPDTEIGRELANLSPIEILSFPALRMDFSDSNLGFRGPYKSDT